MAHGYRTTKTDPAAHEWDITDRVTQLRLWGTDIVYVLSSMSSMDDIVLGSASSASSCSITIADPTSQVSRLHARISPGKAGWVIHDLSSKNGLRLDGAQRDEGVLAPGVEIGVGGVVLVAESEQSIALRCFLERLLGWGEGRRAQVDRALRSVRLAVTHRTPLVLQGEGELVMVACALHRRIYGTGKPFILCDPKRRHAAEANVRSVANVTSARLGISMAVGGSLCVLRDRMPREAAAVFAELQGSRPRAQLIVCVDRGADTLLADPALVPPIIVPPLAQRPGDMDRIIDEYARDAMTELGISQGDFNDQDHDWVRRKSADTLADIERGTRRLVALRTSLSVSGAAERLGMTAVSLSRWFAHRDDERPPLQARSVEPRATRRSRRAEPNHSR